MSNKQAEPTASQLLFSNLGASVRTLMLLWVSTILAVVLVGFALYPAACVYQARKHFESAFGDGYYKQGFLPYCVVLLIVPTTLAIGIGTMALLHQYSIDPALAEYRMLLQTGVLAIVLVVVGWAIAPLLLMIPLGMDPTVGEDPRLRTLAAIALSLTSELSPWRRLAALLVAALTLLAPLVITSHAGEVTGETFLAVLMLSALFVPVASALLIALYARVRPRLDGLRGELPAIPSGLALLTLGAVGLALNGIASGGEHPIGSLLACVLMFLCLTAWLTLLRVSRLRVLSTLSEGLPGGRHAATGYVRRDACVLDLGFARIPLDPSLLGELQDGEEATLVANFQPILPSLRSATPAPPRDGVLFAGALDQVIRFRTRRAVVAAYGWVFATAVMGLFLQT